MRQLVIKVVNIIDARCNHEVWFILLQMYGSLNTKIPNEAADWRLVIETLYIRTAGLE